VTLKYILLQKKVKVQHPWVTSIYLEATFDGKPDELEAIISGAMESDVDIFSLPLPEEVQVQGKYNEFIPQSLLKKQFILDYLDFDGLRDCMLKGTD